MVLARARTALAAHPLAADAVLGLVVGALSILMVLVGPGPHKEPRPPRVSDFVVALVAFGLITLRRRWPGPVLLAATLIAVGLIIADVPRAPLLIAAYVAACTLAFASNRRSALLTGAVVGAILYLASAIFTDEGWADPETIGVVAWVGMAIAIGDGLRTRRAYIAAIEERARRAEQSRDEEARRRVAEERLRIARELHDVVAHNIAMINVQAGVAAHVLRTQPDAADTALAHVRQAARTVLDEISTLLGVLRSPDDAEDSEPTRGLAKLGGLLDSMAAAGLTVEHEQQGEARELPAAVDLAAYRIVQESLTNAQKHGAGRAAHLSVTFTPAGVRIAVTNDANGGVESNGHGLVGMRERATAVGGTLRANRDGGRFVVEADLPAGVRA
ncbi:histidine kinase [Actinoplanes sp. NPDC051633]|uniref:sensor histidine kinase n=1 Tax=Actinoplanes sp. NPDC051633 TaxID=3155670 RepID=UPI00343BD73D